MQVAFNPFDCLLQAYFRRATAQLELGEMNDAVDTIGKCRKNCDIASKEFKDCLGDFEVW